MVLVMNISVQMDMLFVGDILQLPPVTGSPVFSKLCNKLIASRMGIIASVNIWKESIVYDELTKNERQKKDGFFVNILDQVHCGSPTTESLECLKLRVINVPVVDKYVELSKSGFSPVCLFPTRKVAGNSMIRCFLHWTLRSPALMRLYHHTSRPKRLRSN